LKERNNSVSTTPGQDLLDQMRELYAQTILDWRAEREAYCADLVEARLIDERDQARAERDAVLRDRDEAIRQRNWYRVHAEALERELEARRGADRVDQQVRARPSLYQRECAGKYVALVKARRTDLVSVGHAPHAEDDDPREDDDDHQRLHSAAVSRRRSTTPGGTTSTTVAAITTKEEDGATGSPPVEGLLGGDHDENDDPRDSSDEAF